MCKPVIVRFAIVVTACLAGFAIGTAADSRQAPINRLTAKDGKSSATDSAKPVSREAQQAALKEFASLIGEW